MSTRPWWRSRSRKTHRVGVPLHPMRSNLVPCGPTWSHLVPRGLGAWQAQRVQRGQRGPWWCGRLPVVGFVQECFDQCNLGDVVKEKETLGSSILFHRLGDMMMMMMMRRRRRMTIKTNLGLCILGSCEGDIRAARRCSGFSSPLRELTLLLCYFSFFNVIVYLFPIESWLCYFAIFHFSLLQYIFSPLRVDFVSLLFFIVFILLPLLLCYLSFFIVLSSLFKVVFVTLLFSCLCCHFVRHWHRCAHHFFTRNQIHQ